MILPEKAVKEYRDLWMKHYYEEISHSEAYIRARQLIVLLKTLSTILEKSDGPRPDNQLRSTNHVETENTGSPTFKRE